MDFAEAVTKAKNAIKEAEQNERDKKGNFAMRDLEDAMFYLGEAEQDLRDKFGGVKK